MGQIPKRNILGIIIEYIANHVDHGKARPEEAVVFDATPRLNLDSLMVNSGAIIVDFIVPWIAMQ